MTANVWYVTRTCDRVLSSVSATNATTARIRAGAPSVAVQASQMLTTAKSVPFKKKIEMVAQRLSIWAVQRLTSSMKGRNMASKRDDF